MMILEKFKKGKLVTNEGVISPKKDKKVSYAL